MTTSYYFNDLLSQAKRQEQWLYEVTGSLNTQDSYAPDLINPPKEWFYEKPSWWGERARQYSITVDEQGRVAGLIANWDQCYLNVNHVCFTPPRLDGTEKMVYQGNTRVDTGEDIPVSILAATKGHNVTDDVVAAVLANQGFLDDKFKPLESSPDIMAHQLAYGRYVNTEEGIAFLGAIFPHVSASMVKRINASAVSGHWIYDIGEDKHIFAGAVFVNKGALPLKDKTQVQLRQIAASMRYNHIMAQPIQSETCQCQKTQCPCQSGQDNVSDVIAATDPNVQSTDNMDTMPSPNYSAEELSIAVDMLLSRIDVLERAVIELIKAQEIEPLSDVAENGINSGASNGM